MSLYCEESSKTLKSCIFFKILRPNVDLSNPGPFIYLFCPHGITSKNVGCAKLIKWVNWKL